MDDLKATKGLVLTPKMRGDGDEVTT
jgi:hypothetical protein